MHNRWLWLLLLLGWGAKGADCLHVGFFALPPHVLAAKSPYPGAHGPAVDYLQQLARLMDLSLCIQPQPLPLGRLLHELEVGKLDAVLAIGRTAERERFLAYPAQPYYQMQPALMLLADMPLTSINPAQLAGLRIAVYADGFRSPLLRAAGLQLLELYGDNLVARSYRLMRSNQIDAFYSPDGQSLHGLASSAQIGHEVQIIALPESPLGLYTAFSRRTLTPDLLQRYQQAMAQLPPYGHYLLGSAPLHSPSH